MPMQSNIAEELSSGSQSKLHQLLAAQILRRRFSRFSAHSMAFWNAHIQAGDWAAMSTKPGSPQMADAWAKLTGRLCARQWNKHFGDVATRKTARYSLARSGILNVLASVLISSGGVLVSFPR